MDTHWRRNHVIVYARAAPQAALARTPALPAFPAPPGDPQPAYQALLRAGELVRRVPQALASLTCCAGCPRGCRVDRVNGARLGLCRTGRLAQVASAGPDAEIEDCLRGPAGAGRIVFAGGGLRCVFCGPAEGGLRLRGAETPPERLAGLMLDLQAAGCSCLDLINAGHVVPQVLEALLLAARRGLRLPLIYSTSAYDGLASLRFLDGVVDVYRPSFRLWDPILSLRYLRARNYPLAARRAIREMHRQVGDLRLDASGRAQRGLLVRHAVLPGGAAGTRAVVRWVARTVSPHAALCIQAQPLPPAEPAVSLERYPELSQAASPAEVAQAVSLAQGVGLRVLD